jgi:hypothetical protein
MNIAVHESIGRCACLVCLRTLSKCQVIAHLRDIHKESPKNLAIAEEIVPNLPGIIYSHNDGTIRWPSGVLPALEGIIVEQGYHCQFCNAAYRTDNSMKTHLRTKHPEGHEQWRGRKLPMGPMQSLSGSGADKGWKSRSFQVTLEDCLD